MTSTKVQWRVQYRLSRKHKWENAGLFETREDARAEASWHRLGGSCLVNGGVKFYVAVGFGNTRVVRYVKGQ